MYRWFIASRPWSLTASAVPVILGASLASAGVFPQPGLFALTLIGGLALHLGCNYLNTYGDFISGVDTVDSAVSCPQLVTGAMRPKDIRLAGLLFLAAGLATGVVLGWLCGWPVLFFGLLGACGAYGYTTGTRPYKYEGLGPMCVFLLMGPLMTLPAYYVQTGELSVRAALGALPISFLVTAIMHGNDLRDIDHDRRAGIRTLAMRLGFKRGLQLFMLLCAGAYVSLLLLTAWTVYPVTALLPLLLVPAHVHLMRSIRQPVAPEAVSRLEGESARLHFLFGILLILGVLLPRLMEILGELWT